MQVGRGVKRRGLMGRMKEPGSGCVSVQLWNSVIGVSDENKKGKCVQGLGDRPLLR